jgi:hypothetical protein
MKKYELTKETKVIGGKTLFRIRALRSFGDIKAGDLGGFIENERNLSHEGNAWVVGNARVGGNAWVGDNAKVGGCAWVGDEAWVIENAVIEGNAKVGGNALVCGNAQVVGNAQVGGCAWVGGNALVGSDTRFNGDGLINSNDDYLCEKGLGSHNRSASFFKCKDGHIHVLCGCFDGNLDEFENKVKEEHGNSKYAKEYLGFIEVVKTHFEVRQ